MGKTSDERREVAARLREDASCSESSPRDVVESYLGIEYDGADVLEESYTSESLLHIADLIDPTCEVEPMPDCVPHHRFARLMCGKCGLVSFTPSNATGPSYCPYCGHRWVTRDGHE